MQLSWPRVQPSVAKCRRNSVRWPGDAEALQATPPGGKLFLLVMCLAGLGVGVWLFGKRGADSEWNGRPEQDGL